MSGRAGRDPRLPLRQPHVPGRSFGCRRPARGLVAAAVPLAVLLFGAAIVELIPRLIVGGVLVFVGLSFIVEWVWDRRRSLPRTEYVVVLVIVAVVMVRGYVPGFVVGIVLSVVLFAISYGRVDLVHEVPSATCTAAMSTARVPNANACERAPTRSRSCA